MALDRSNGAATPLLEVDRLVRHFAVRRGFFGRKVGAVKAVDDISFTVGTEIGRASCRGRV